VVRSSVANVVRKASEPAFSVELLQCGVWKFVDSMAGYQQARLLQRVEFDVRKLVLFTGMKLEKVGLN
jgi:hypothetical protein